LLDGLGKHPIDVELDAFGLGEFQNLTLDIGQLRRRQIVEIDISDVGSLQVSQVVGNVDFVFHQRLEGHDLEGALVGGGQHHRGGATILVSPKPIQGGDAPAVAGQQPGKPILGNRRQQVITDGALVLEKLGGHHRTDRVTADVLGPAGATTVAVVTGEGLGAARLQLAAEHVAIGHLVSIAPPGQKFEEASPSAPGKFCSDRDRYRAQAIALGFEGHIQWAASMPD
jgi:hypothetical protein